MKNLRQVFEKLEQFGISVTKYKEKNKLCGYELNTYTHSGVNMVLFIDFRDTGMNPRKAKDFIEIFNERVNSIDIEEEIGYLRQDKNYIQAKGTGVGYQDLKKWKENISNIFIKTANQKQFEQVVKKFRSSIKELEKIVELMPTKGDSKYNCQKINILHHINELSYCINGIELDDFTPNEYSQDFQLAYS